MLRKIFYLFIFFITFSCSEDISEEKEQNPNITIEAGSKLYDIYKAFSETKPPPLVQHKIGEELTHLVLKKYRYFEHPSLLLYLSQVGQTLAMASDLPDTYQGYRFIPLESTQAKSFSLPGGYVFITTQMIRLCHNEDQLAAVLGHAISRITLGQHFYKIQHENKTKTMNELGKFALMTTLQNSDDNGDNQSYSGLNLAFNTILDEVAASNVKSYDITLLKKADIYTLNLLSKTGYHPASLLEMIKQVRAKKAYIEPAQRIQALKSYLKQNPVYQPPVQSTRTLRFQNIIRKIQ